MESLESVFNQSYTAIEVIVLDDASTDGSVNQIGKLMERYPRITFIRHAENRGNCASFNEAFLLAKGDYIVDFATDDIMEPERILKQVECFQELDSSWGVVFTDATYIDESGKNIRHHFEHLFKKRRISHVRSGDVYRHLLSSYFIAAPTMMVRREVVEYLQGYDENLEYEDFDFWVRSSRRYKYYFLNERLTKIRKWKNSMSSTWYKQGDKQLHSTYLVCEKALLLNESGEDNDALVIRIRFELRQSVFSQNHEEAALFFQLLRKMKRVSLSDFLLDALNKLKLPLSPLRELYHRIRFR